MPWNEDNLAPPDGSQQQGWQAPPVPPPPPPPPIPEQTQKGGGCSGAGRWIACGCAAVLAGIILLVGGITWVVVYAIRSSDMYSGAMDRARRDPRVIDLLGEPLETYFFPTGSINTEGNTGSANVTIPVRGPKGKGKLHATASKEGGTWTYSALTLTTETGQTIDLLTPPPESTSTTPPGG